MKIKDFCNFESRGSVEELFKSAYISTSLNSVLLFKIVFVFIYLFNC